MTLYDLRKKYGKKYEEAPDTNTTNIYRNIVIDITEQINEVEFRVSQLEKEIESFNKSCNCSNETKDLVNAIKENKIETLRGVLGK